MLSQYVYRPKIQIYREDCEALHQKIEEYESFRFCVCFIGWVNNLCDKVLIRITLAQEKVHGINWQCDMVYRKESAL